MTTSVPCTLLSKSTSVSLHVEHTLYILSTMGTVFPGHLGWIKFLKWHSDKFVSPFTMQNWTLAWSHLLFGTLKWKLPMHFWLQDSYPPSGRHGGYFLWWGRAVKCKCDVVWVSWPRCTEVEKQGVAPQVLLSCLTTSIKESDRPVLPTLTSGQELN